MVYANSVNLIFSCLMASVTKTVHQHLTLLSSMNVHLVCKYYKIVLHKKKY